MKKAFLKVLTVLIIFFSIFWISAIIKCEVLTLQHWTEFEGLEEATNMISNSETIKVLEYSDSSARVYYKNHEGGNVLIFTKQDGEWVYSEWERTVWSRTGSADDIIWPYIR